MPRAQDAQEWPAFAGMTILHQKRSQFPRTVLDLRRNDEGLRARPVPDGRRNLKPKARGGTEARRESSRCPARFPLVKNRDLSRRRKFQVAQAHVLPCENQ